ncbi:hypothetical protein R5R35_011550 [Gryllus longicercus]|uniref:Uncharacterized protein n=1 Tax=Gryllus longicercus TaxID=2509291 RepID=A0AAN9W0L0_9ORTH
MSEQNFIDIAKNATVNKSISKYEEKCLSKLYSKFQQLLEDAMKSDIDEYIEKSGFLEAQETISRTIPDNVPTSSAAAWRPSGDPHQDMKSHEAENLMKCNEMLQDVVDEQVVKIQCLKQDIAHKRVLTHQLMKTLTNMQEDFMKLSSNNSSLQDLIVEMLSFLNRDVKK